MQQATNERFVFIANVWKAGNMHVCVDVREFNKGHTGMAPRASLRPQLLQGAPDQLWL